jgi:hypothetical protein
MRESERRSDMTKDMRTRWILAGPVAALALGFSVAVPISADAAPLDPQACEQLQLKLDGLRRDGVEADMALGAAQAKSTLPAERLSRIGVFIETEEQLNFRCGLAKHRISLPTTIEGGEEELPGPTETTVEGGPGASPLPQRAPRAAKEAGASKGSPAGKAPSAGGKAPAAAGAKSPAEGAKRRPSVAKAKEASAATATPAAKPAASEGEARKVAKKKTGKKSDDAYRPPAKPAAREETAPPTAKQ